MNIMNPFYVTGPMLFLFHRAWLLEFENSIRAINPQIEALPYWNYARDMTEFDMTHSESIFSDKYLGSYVGRESDYSLVNGKFRFWKISTDVNNKYKSAFGYLRHPLSSNKSPYVTRNGGHF